MGKSALLAVLLPIAVTAITLPAWAVLVARPGIEQLQSVADRACKCERRSGSKACWQPLTRIIREDLGEASGTACYPLSTEMLDLDASAAGASVVLRYDIVEGNGLYLCSKAEAVAGEAIWNREMNRSEDAGDKHAVLRANAALRRFADALRRGQRLEAIKPSAGCATGYGR
jgi:hypothetical protein